MKTLRPIFQCLTALAIAAACLAGAAPTRAATASSNAPTPAGTNAVAIIPLSVFDPAMATGRDPFFPRSNRRSIEVNASKGNAASSDPTNLALQGLSHSSKRPMATINNQSFSPGEEGEVVTSSGRVRIRCEEIKPDSVVISIGANQRLELRMPQRN